MKNSIPKQMEISAISKVQAVSMGTGWRQINHTVCERGGGVGEGIREEGRKKGQREREKKI